jgi:hypothetical protein
MAEKSFFITGTSISILKQHFKTNYYFYFSESYFKCSTLSICDIHVKQKILFINEMKWDEMRWNEMKFC